MTIKSNVISGILGATIGSIAILQTTPVKEVRQPTVVTEQVISVPEVSATGQTLVDTVPKVVDTTPTPVPTPKPKVKIKKVKKHVTKKTTPKPVVTPTPNIFSF